MNRAFSERKRKRIEEDNMKVKEGLGGAEGISLSAKEAEVSFVFGMVQDVASLC